MAQIDEIKERINWLKDLFKILVMVIIALIAGISKLFLNKDFDILHWSNCKCICYTLVSDTLF